MPSKASAYTTGAARQPTELEACCKLSYGHPAARWLMGDSFHPGGIELTDRLAGLLAIGPSDNVLDAGSGLGTTAVRLAESKGCEVTGATLEAEGVVAGEALARTRGVSDRVSFIQGDFAELPANIGPFSVALMECVLSIVPDKGRALGRLRRRLGHGARLGLSDVTVEGDLPAEFEVVMARAGCLAGALPQDAYEELLRKEGFAVEESVDCHEAATSFLAGISVKLQAARLAIGLGHLNVPKGILDQAERLIGLAAELADRRVIGYSLVVARRAD